LLRTNMLRVFPASALNAGGAPVTDVVKLCRLAVQTNVYPLYEVINGRYVLNKSVKKSKSVREYLKMQGRFKYLTTEQTETTQQEADSRYAKLEWLASGPAIP